MPATAAPQLTYSDACARLGLSRSTVERLVARGAIGYTRLGARLVRFHESDIADYLTRQHSTPTPADVR